MQNLANASVEMNNTTLYNYFVRHISKYNILIIGEDMNAQIG